VQENSDPGLEAAVSQHVAAALHQRQHSRYCWQQARALPKVVVGLCSSVAGSKLPCQTIDGGNSYSKNTNHFDKQQF